MKLTVNTCNQGRENCELHGPGSTPADKGIENQVLSRGSLPLILQQLSGSKVAAQEFQATSIISASRIQRLFHFLVDLAHYLNKITPT